MRLFGSDIEYGLQIEGRDVADQLEDSAEVIRSLQANSVGCWDYALESPRCDLRGFSVDRLTTDPADSVWDVGRVHPPESELRSDRVLENGARLYNDHGHPEYATPECRRIADALAHELAGERIVLQAAKDFQERTGRAVKIYKNNTDYHGASYGSHENYLVPRSVQFADLLSHLVPFLISRSILFAAGKVGSESRPDVRFQLSQRADFFTELASVDTLYRRPIFNTRDEPHAEQELWIRLHVICGDANRMPWSIAMKFGTMSLVLRLLEMGDRVEWALRDPVTAFRDASRILDGSRIETTSGWTNSAEVLDDYRCACESRFRGIDAETDWVLDEWNAALEDFRTDWTRLADRVDWAAKRLMLEQFCGQVETWDAPLAQSLDLEYHNLEPQDSLFDALVAEGQTRTVIPESRILDAMSMPPQDTRAQLRAEVVRTYGEQVQAIGWRRAIISAGPDHSRVVEFPVNWETGTLSDLLE